MKCRTLALLLLCDAELRKLPSLSERAHWAMYNNYALANGMLDDEAKLFFKRPNDFITTRTDRIHGLLEWLMYGRQDNFIVVRPLYTYKSPRPKHCSSWAD